MLKERVIPLDSNSKIDLAKVSGNRKIAAKFDKVKANFLMG